MDNLLLKEIDDCFDILSAEKEKLESPITSASGSSSAFTTRESFLASQDSPVLSWPTSEASGSTQDDSLLLYLEEGAQDCEIDGIPVDSLFSPDDVQVVQTLKLKTDDNVSFELVPDPASMDPSSSTGYNVVPDLTDPSSGSGSSAKRSSTLDILPPKRRARKPKLKVPVAKEAVRFRDLQAKHFLRGDELPNRKNVDFPGIQAVVKEASVSCDFFYFDSNHDNYKLFLKEQYFISDLTDHLAKEAKGGMIPVYMHLCKKSKTGKYKL